MKYLLTTLMIALLVPGEFRQAEKDRRTVYFYFFNDRSSQSERLNKTLGRISDSLIFSNIELIVKPRNKKGVTYNCIYVNNAIVFNKVGDITDTTEHINLSFDITLDENKKKLKLTIPYSYLFRNTDEKSQTSISVERKNGKLYYIVLSKLDYPFITSSMYVKPR